MSLEQQFQDAAAKSRNLPPQSNESLLNIYALYKQASSGDVSGPKPGGFDFKGKAKYEAWSKLEGTSKEKAMEDYIALINSLGA